MARFQSRGGGRGGGRGGSRGSFRGGSRGGVRGNGRLARSGIRTRAGYRKFDSQRVKDLEQTDSESAASEVEEEQPQEDIQSEDDDVGQPPTVRSYNALLSSLHQPAEANGRPRKRRKIDVPEKEYHSDDNESSEGSPGLEVDDDDEQEVEENLSVSGEATLDHEADDEDGTDPFEVHFANPNANKLSQRLESIQAHQWRSEKQNIPSIGNITLSAPATSEGNIIRKTIFKSTEDLPLKKRLSVSSQKHMDRLDPLQQAIAPYLVNYNDLMLGNRTPNNAQSLRDFTCLHALNHVLKSRDKVIKNSARLSHSEQQDLDLRDQGFTRPKVLILLETREMCVKYANSIVDLFGPEQQENKQRFQNSFSSPIDDRDTLPEDYRELFEGNNDNNFLTAMKFTRKTVKFYAPFYTSDIIFASPLGLRRILEDEDPKKRDYDFLSSVEIVIVDQADAMQMQNWENVESVFRHLNLQLKEAHGCDFSRVRSWYLDGNAKYLRQTIVLSAYITPEMNRLFNSSMLNEAGKAKLVPDYTRGAIAAVAGMGIKQTFSRFESSSPETDPEGRFKYFTSSVLPSMLRTPKPADGAKGILVFVPSYYDFLRLRNFFATSTLTQNVTFGAIHDYSDVSAQRRARSHFLNGRHSVLLYTQRAHHFYRLKIRGIKKVVMYGAPDNPVFYEEMTAGFLGTSLEEGKVGEGEASLRVLFSKWDGLKLERIVGSQRMKGMLGGRGDTFDFV